MSKTNFEFVHDELYGKALDASSKFISTSILRPVLNYALHKENGELIATDSHKLIQVKGIHGFKEEYLVSPKTAMFAKGEFPDLGNVLNKENHAQVVKINKEQIKLWLQIFKSINQILRTMKDRTNEVLLRFEDKTMNAYIKMQDVSINLPVEEYKKLEGLDQIMFRPEYLRDSLEAHQKLNSESLMIYFRSNIRPMIMDDGEKVTTVVLPLRTY